MRGDRQTVDAQTRAKTGINEFAERLMGDILGASASGFLTSRARRSIAASSGCVLAASAIVSR